MSNQKIVCRVHCQEDESKEFEIFFNVDTDFSAITDFVTIKAYCPFCDREDESLGVLSFSARGIFNISLNEAKHGTKYKALGKSKKRD